jgi:PAS domain S-box-containing protein
MIESATPKNDLPREASIPHGAASLESIVCTEELRRRAWRPPDYEKEISALVALVSTLADSPHTILQTLADKVLEVLHADSAGLSLLTKDQKRFYWAAIAGAWQPHIGGGTPRDFGPCGDVLDHNIPMLFTHWERRYPYLSSAVPLADEGLLVPFYVKGKAVGTIWAIAHNTRRKFDAEDLRLLESMSRFASAAYQAVESIEALKLEITAREKAEAKQRELADGLEAKIRRLVDSNIIGIFIWNLDGRIVDANEAFLRIVGYGRDDLTSGQLRWMGLTPAEWRAADDRRVAELKATGTTHPYEKEYFHKSGSRVPVLVGAVSFEGRSDEGVAFVLDLTDRKRAEWEAHESERRYHEAQMELAHANRVATLGQLSASIAHEINQPIAAAVNNASAALRWLGKEPPDLEQARQALNRIFKNGNRASEVIGRMRALLKKAPLHKEDVDINEAIIEVIALTRGEITKNGISVQTQHAEGLPFICGDRVQLQQVILNLIINAVEALSSVGEGPRELIISTGETESNGVLVAVRDSGPGLAPESAERMFESFYTTKPGGLGMGLSICRSIVEAHQGRLWACSNTPRGAIFQFTLPSHSHAGQSDA